MVGEYRFNIGSAFKGEFYNDTGGYPLFVSAFIRNRYVDASYMST